MATSQNGYGVYSSSAELDKAPLVRDVLIPGGLRNDDCGYVLRYVAVQFDKRVEKLRKGWCWGWAYRAIRGKSSGYSNHASATAEDLNAPEHPLGVANTFSSAQEKEIHEILAEVDHVVRWGGDYEKRKDEMHFEINAPYSEVQRVAQKLRKPKPPVVVTPSQYKDYQKVRPATRVVSLWDSGDDVKELQRVLDAFYSDVTLTPYDGYFGPNTDKAVRLLQGRAGLIVDGEVGPRTWAVLGFA